ncbi:MAG: ABC transporter ATP-binding protein/permease, partial [Lachnospiraceae bacterium]|nr:ABC transporter ATP-binding protein/permease [Lachnospiraceae bacterium]
LQIQSSMTEGTYDGGNGRVVNDSCAVEFADVSVRYCNASEDSLQGITLEVKKGSVIGIIGGTGSGKTTLVNLIPRFYDVTKGTVRVDGMDVKEYRYQTLRDKIGIVPQKSVLFTGTIRSNMQWGKKDATDEEIMKALEIAQAKEFVLQKDGGLDAEVAQGGKNFSGGQRQRLAIARAIVKHPKILILDDSASALDYATDAALRKAIREMEDPPTLFIVSQRTASMMHADQILVLEDGEAAGLGTHEELLKTCEVYKEIYDSQFKKEAKGGVANA